MAERTYALGYAGSGKRRHVLNTVALTATGGRAWCGTVCTDITARDLSRSTALERTTCLHCARA